METIFPKMIAGTIIFLPAVPTNLAGTAVPTTNVGTNNDNGNKKGQAKVDIIIPNPVVIQSSHLLPQSIQRQIDAGDLTISMSVIYFSLNT